MSDEDTRLRFARIELDYGRELLDLLQIADAVGGKQGQHLQQWSLQAAEALFVVNSLKHKLLAGQTILITCAQCRKPLSMPDVSRDHTVCTECRGESDTPIDPNLYVLSA